RPLAGGYLLESVTAFKFIGAVLGSAFLVWLATKAPGDRASEKTKAAWVAMSGAVAVYINESLITPAEPRASLLESAIRKKFKGSFLNRRDDFEKDAMEAVTRDS